MFPLNVLVFGVEMLELRHRLFEVVFPAFVVFALWLDGLFFPLVLLPLLYVKFVDKKRIGMDWVSWKENSQFWVAWCLFVSWSCFGLVSVLCLLFAKFGKRVPNCLRFVHGCALVSPL